MALSNGLLWSIQQPESKPSYLLGTIHMNSVFFERHFMLFKKILSECHTFAAEVNLDQLQGIPMAELFRMNDLPSWFQLLRENQRVKLEKRALQYFNIHIQDYQSYHPILLIHLLTLQMIEIQNAKSFDQSLWELADDLGLEKTGLESIEQHFDAMHSYPVPQQIKMLKKLIANPVKARTRLKQMVKHYNQQDIKYLYQESKRMLGSHRKSMLYDRNAIMVQKILNEMQTKSCFFSCGAAHLYGSFGVLRLLKNKSCLLKPIPL
ncbi:MAG: TraB/GumN family protein [Saprospiraceae bacterium]|nr:TraB/GumN family protein [Saprospiraceae bacterium]